MQLTKTQITLAVALLLGNATVLYSDPGWVWLRMPAALALTLLLPGWAWLPTLGWLRTTDAIERGVLIGTLSSLLTALVLLIVLLLPGPFTETPVLIGVNVLTLAGLLSQFHPAAQTEAKLDWPSLRVLLILLAIIGVAAFTRLYRLDYAEFHEDELENMRLIVRAYKGEEYAPFLDSKGPIHWILPASLWYLNGWVTEGIARAPFVATSLLLIPMIYTLGRRLSNGRESIGLLAAGFVAINGFYVAYARFVENQPLIILWATFAFWLIYRYYREDIHHFLLLVALALAVGLIAHPNVLLYLPVFGFVLLMKLVRDWPRTGRGEWGWLAGAGVLFAGLLAMFYVPYFTDPNIVQIRQYFAEERIGDALLYNRVPNLLDQDYLYSTRYHAPILILLLAWLLLRAFSQWRWLGWAGLAILGAACVTTVTAPAWWDFGTLNFAFIPYALITLAFLFLPRTPFEFKMMFLWLMAPLGALLFLAKDAADHIQIAYTAWALLAAFALVDVWGILADSDAPNVFVGDAWRPIPPPTLLGFSARSVLAGGLAIAVMLILSYQYLAFNARVMTYWQAKIDAEESNSSIYDYLYAGLSRPRKIFSNPRLGGWKAVGYLHTTGQLQGDFRSVNESFAVPIWYTFQTPRSCYEDPDNYWLRRDWQEWPDEEADIIAQGYTLTRVVRVDGEPKLHLYQKHATLTEPQILDVDDYRAAFNRLATPSRFAVSDTPAQPSNLTFGAEELRLLGYEISPQPAQPGELLPVTVYWESLGTMEVRYRAFMHLVAEDGSLWGQHDDDPACRLLTTDMREGQRSERQFRIPVAPDIPPGEYNIVFGLYHPETLERLPIWDATTTQPVGTQVTLGRVIIDGARGE